NCQAGACIFYVYRACVRHHGMRPLGMRVEHELGALGAHGSGRDPPGTLDYLVKYDLRLAPRSICLYGADHFAVLNHLELLEWKLRLCARGDPDAALSSQGEFVARSEFPDSQLDHRPVGNERSALPNGLNPVVIGKWEL